MKPNAASQAQSTLGAQPEDSAPQNSESAEFEQILFHITHDLRASLRAARILPDWVIEDLKSAGVDVPNVVEENLDLLKIQVGLADQLLVDLLTYSRVGRRADRPDWQDLGPAIDAALVEAKMPASFEVSRKLDVTRVFMPANELRVLLSQILHNAWWHHGAKAGVVQISSTTSDGRVLVRIADDGVGIPHAHHERVFEMLSTLHPRDVRPGSGLGLAISRKIATHAGGGIRIVPEHTRGTTIEVDLPIPVVGRRYAS